MAIVLKDTKLDSILEKLNLSNLLDVESGIWTKETWMDEGNIVEEYILKNEKGAELCQITCYSVPYAIFLDGKLAI